MARSVVNRREPVARRASEATTQSARAVGVLTERAVQLREMVARFRLRDAA